MTEMLKSGERTFRVVVHEDGPEDFWAEVAELPGCFASGSTFPELQEALAEAIAMYLSSDGQRVSLSGERWQKVEDGPQSETSEQDLRVLVGAG